MLHSCVASKRRYIRKLLLLFLAVLDVVYAELLIYYKSKNA